ncbi:hypothetical protein TWF694_001967 [Orbilia ellipsospora]|uniref:Uncharacterized protein n=1 Tax=Orbilia ellipsospora TaxID=2528407 RepID=A0AAV9X469_9PEZI
MFSKFILLASVLASQALTSPVADTSPSGKTEFENSLAKRGQGDVYLCHELWEQCWSQYLSNNQCANFNDQVEVAVLIPGPSTGCILYADWNCQGQLSGAIYAPEGFVGGNARTFYWARSIHCWFT